MWTGDPENHKVVKNVCVLLFGMLREHGKSSQLRSHGFLFCFFPKSEADCWESIIFSFQLENLSL